MLIKKTINYISKLILIVYVLFVYNIEESNAQGFPWQYSARLPVDIPKFYYGINVNYGYIISKGALSFLEDDINCLSFKNGTGSSLSFGINGEYWNQTNSFAYTFALNYIINNLNYKFTDFVPISKDITAEYENRLDLDYSNIAANVGIKYRLLNTHFHLGAGLSIATSLLSNFNVKERIIGPETMPPFQTNPPSYERDIINGQFDDFSIIEFYPNISFGYDLNFGNGKYLTPVVSMYIPIMDVMKHDNVRNLIFTAGIKANFNF